MQAGSIAKKESPPRTAVPVLASVPANCDHADLCGLSRYILSETQSQPPTSLKVSLNWAKLGLASTEADMGSAQTVAQKSADIWPMRAEGNSSSVLHYTVTSLYQLGSCPSGATVCSVEFSGSGGSEGASSEAGGDAPQRSVTLCDGTFVLTKADCLMLSGSCSSLMLSMITFQGVTSQPSGLFRACFGLILLP